jgi:uncharacterized protein YcgI (DUF1989 family)
MSEGVATAGTARPGSRTTVTGGTGGAVRVAAGHRVHVVNTLGQQVADTWAVGLHGGSTLSMSHTRLAMGRVTPRVGDVLVDDLRQPMLAVPIGEPLPLDQIAAAHDRVDAGSSGRVLLAIS